MQVQHMSQNDAWRTPPHILDMVRDVLEGIDFDPASSAEANREVRAERFYAREDDALTKPWPAHCSVYLNPPGGRRGRDSMVRLFWQRLMAYRAEGHLEHAIFAMFSVEGLQTTQGDHPPAMTFPFCIPSKRVRWVHPTEVKTAPSHSNAFIYVPGNKDCTSRFVQVFQSLGCCAQGLLDYDR